MRGFGFLAKIFRLPIIGNRSTYATNTGLEKNLALLKFTTISKLTNRLGISLRGVHVVISISRPVKNHSSITLVPQLCKIAQEE